MINFSNFLFLHSLFFNIFIYTTKKGGKMKMK